jgi:hypothetical protein
MKTIEIPVSWVLDPELAHRDLGVLLRLMTFDPSHSVKLDELAQMSPNGVDSARAAIEKLIDLNYVSRRALYRSGRRRGTLYAIRSDEIASE